MIEYVDRVISEIKKRNEDKLDSLSKQQILGFITYPFWMKKDSSILVSSG